MEIALETSVRAASLAIHRFGDVRSISLDAEKAHASDLFSRLEDLVRSIGASPDEFTAVIVGVGPGSYTGLRVGVATALGIARGSNAALCAIPSVEAIAHQELDAPSSEGVVLLDARGGQLYFAHYRRVEHGVETIVEPCVTTPAELPKLLPNLVRIFGDETVGAAAQLDDDALARLETGAIPKATTLLEIGQRRLEVEGPTPPEAVRPLYLRPFEARPRKR
jgi:tRNA threonylcarbamoyladenosine biosynthesis protein TsaB